MFFSRCSVSRCDGVRGGVAGGDPHRDPAAGGGHEGVAGAGDLGAVEAGDRERGLGPEPLDGRALADPVDAGDGAGLGAQPLLGVLDVRRRAGVQARDGDVAAVVVEGADQPGERHQRVGHQPAPHAGVHGVRQGADLDVHPDQAAQARGQGGHADVPVAGVRDHDDVGAEVVEVLLQQCRQRLGADLLLALDEEDDVDRQVVAEDPQRGEVGGDAGLVVGGAAAVEAVAPLGRLERRRSPSRRGRSRAGRRGGRTAARSARHPVPSCARSPPGRRRRRWRCASCSPRPPARRRTASALRRTSPARSGSALTDSIRTRSSRSRRTPGSTSATRARRSSVVGVVVAMRARATDFTGLRRHGQKNFV